jgi:C4-dicarboxylate-specific signal transduction histidine kinase
MKPTILIVDDEKTTVSLLSQILSVYYDVKTAYDGTTALQMMKELEPCIVLLDIQMGELNGYDVAESMKNDEKLKDIPFIFITASDSRDSIMKGFQVGAVDYIVKPFCKEELLVRIGTHISQCRLKDDLKNANHQLKQKINEEVDKRLAVERALIQQSKLAEIGNMIENVLHQWKQPLNTVSILATSLKIDLYDEHVNKDLLVKYCNDILEQNKFMGDTVTDFKNFFATNKSETVFNVRLSIDKIVKILKYRFQSIVVDVEINGDSSLNVKGYENEFGQVLLNILNNAVDAFDDIKDKKHKISINISLEDKYIVISIQDNAGGICESLLPNRLFQNYISTKGENGTGIGLALSRQIIEDNFRGSLIAYNKDDGAVLEIKLLNESY